MKKLRLKEEETHRPEKVIQTTTEKKLKKKIIDLLKDDGEGHHHAKYAARLADFPIKIVSREDDPSMTAAISWDDATIYVSDGFVSNDPVLFKQLNVLMRHELAHYLMQHELRMARQLIDKYGDETYSHLKKSKSFHELLNIIEDFEISNKRYTPRDKELIRNLILGNRVISGLVTEDLRKQWNSLTVEQMYKALEEEINEIQKSIIARWDALDLSKIGNKFDMIDRSITQGLKLYSDTNHPTNFFGTLDEFIKNKALYHFAPYDGPNGICVAKYSSLPDYFQEIITSINEEFCSANNYTKQDLRKLVIEIGKSDALKAYELKGNRGNNVITLYTPEEKFIAIDALKAMIPSLEEYNTWYAKIQKTLSDAKYSDDDRKKIFDAINV